MKKFLFFLIILGVAGYAVWHYGTDFAAEKIMDKIQSSISNEDLEKIKSYAKNDPRVQQILSDAANIDPDTLPFHTKEDATRVLIKKVGVNRLLEIKEQAENGTIDKNQLLSEIEGKLSEDEKSAFKYVLYQELFN